MTTTPEEPQQPSEQPLQENNSSKDSHLPNGNTTDEPSGQRVVPSSPEPSATLAQVPQVKKGPNVGVILGVFLLLVALVGSGLFFLLRSQPSKNQSSRSQTPTSHTCLTGQQALFCDDFADNSKGWNTRSDADHTITIQNHLLTIVSAHSSKIGVSLPLPTTHLFDNFMLTFTYTILDANTLSVGAFVRTDSKLGNGYSVDVLGDDTASILKYSVMPGQIAISFLSLGVKVTSLKPVGQQNTMTVIMKGSTLVLMMNGSVVVRVNDNDYTTGLIALSVSQGKVSFSRVAVYPAPDKLPLSS